MANHPFRSGVALCYDSQMITAAPRHLSPPLLIALHHHRRSSREEERAHSTISLHEVDANARLIGALHDDCNIALSLIRDDREGASSATKRNPRMIVAHTYALAANMYVHVRVYIYAYVRYTYVCMYIYIFIYIYYICVKPDKSRSTLDHTEHTVYPRAFITSDHHGAAVRYVNRHRPSAGRRTLSLRRSTLRRRPFITSS